MNENTKGIFSEDRFTYDTERDTVICPAGKQLKRRTLHAHTQNIEYAASKKDCRLCSLKSQCTKSKGVRTVQLHVRQEEFNHMFAITKTPFAKRDLKNRQHLMERSCARSTRFGFDRARWRGVWKVAIQEYLFLSWPMTSTGRQERYWGANGTSWITCGLPFTLSSFPHGRGY
ncbi:MAG: transposase [Proteobacteria bacterium]|nr:transposase [Pseudomonadota bacterium]